MQVLAKLLIEIISPHLTTATCVRWEKVDPLWYVKLTAFVKGIGLSYGPLHVVLVSVLWNLQSCVRPANAR